MFSTPNLLGSFTGPIQPLILPHLRQENADLTSKHGRRRDMFKLQYQVQDRRTKRAPVRLLRPSCTWMRCCGVLPLQEWAVWWREVWHRAGRILDVGFGAWLGRYVRFCEEKSRYILPAYSSSRLSETLTLTHSCSTALQHLLTPTSSPEDLNVHLFIAIALPNCSNVHWHWSPLHPCLILQHDLHPSRA